MLKMCSKKEEIVNCKLIGNAHTHTQTHNTQTDTHTQQLLDSSQASECKNKNAKYMRNGYNK